MTPEQQFRQEMEGLIDANNRENLPPLLVPFDPNDPDPLATLSDARRSAFRIVAQCLIEPHLVNLDFQLRAYLILRDQGVENPWAQVVAAGESDQGPNSFIEDADFYHNLFQVGNIDKQTVRKAARPVQNDLQDVTNHTLLALLGEAEPLAENWAASPGLILNEDRPRPYKDTTAKVEILLAMNDNAALMQQVFQTAKERILRDASRARTNFTIGLVAASRNEEDKAALTATTRRLQTSYVRRVDPILSDIASSVPGLTDRQRRILPAVSRVFRVNPPPAA